MMTTLHRRQTTTDISETPDPPIVAGDKPVIVQAQVGDPLALGLAGFGMTAFVLSAFNSGWFNAKLEPVALPMALFYGGLIVLLSGMWAFKRNETFPGVVLSAFGSFWLCFAAYAKFVLPGLPADTAGSATGLFLIVWAVFCGYVLIPALKTNLAVFTVILGTGLTFFFLAIGNFHASTGLVHAGGVFGLLTGSLAMYTSCALMTNASFGKTILPLKPFA